MRASQTLDLGSRLRAARKAAGLSQERLAVQANLSVATLTRIEGGHYRPRLATLDALADVLGVSVSSLLEDTDHPEAAAAG